MKQVTTMTKNLHMSHPEDEILTGNLDVLDWFIEEDSFISTKVDGSPALVWGTNPATNRWFVATKAAFNKKKIRIAHSHREIDQYYTGNVARILHKAFDCLPRTNLVIQGDWIGEGGDCTYKPNTITYDFPEVVEESIIICPHTFYIADKDLRDAMAFPLTSTLESTEFCRFVQPDVYMQPASDNLKYMVKYAKQMATLCDFMTPQKATKVKKYINDCIRNDVEVVPEVVANTFDVDVYTISLWHLVVNLKDILFLAIHEQDDIECSIAGEDCLHEGYCIHNQFGSFKMVIRNVFSRSNFLIEKTW